MSVKDINVDFPHDLKKSRISHDFSHDRCEFTMLENQDPVPLHTHNFDELVFIFSGSAVHAVDDDQYPIIRGDVFVVRGNHKHGYSNPKHLNVVNVLYQREYFESLKIKFADLPGFNALFVHEPIYRKKHKFKSKLYLNSQQLQKVSRLLNFMTIEQQDEWAGTPASKECIFELMVIDVCKCFSEFNSPRPKALLKISAAIDYIEQNFYKPISNALLSNKAGMLPSSFRYSFKKVTGLAPIDYLIKLRIEKAADMMAKNSRMRVTDAAMNSGFDNSAYFTRKFRDIIGMTPMAYLKKQRSMVS